ncbi:hypothetical protein K505DRAFT_357516 [Melanomma pulvis-pyrius CBS 109.77]|uniref:Rhodopsin domain-containing protein n=1 Tax=Melanomma pulvis-pyrius CBS 109.77 TaxID=1314802 RepID=A0A6A6XPF8_9PLEO|nr:hypothetical protein K505DRAFT_357516 [Melanomma pulvis-pyrius CBS 109.77]
MLAPSAKGLLVVGVTATQCLLALVFVCLRAWARIRILGGSRYDDYLLWAAMVLLIAITGDSIVAVYYGLGHHAAELQSPKIVLKLSKYMFAYPVLWSFSLLVSKAAVVAFLLMIVAAKRTHKIILWISIGICGVLSFLEFLGLFVQCFPVKANWNPFMEKRCHFDVDMVGYLLTAYGAFLDFFLAALPWIFLRGLQIKRKEKITICISLSAGFFAGICGIIRLAELVKLQQSTDAIYEFYSAIIWTSTETSVSIICVSLPATRTLYRRYVKGLRSSPDSTGVSRHHAQYGYALQDRSRNPANRDVSSRSNTDTNDNNKSRKAY